MRITAHGIGRLVERMTFAAISHETLPLLIDQCVRAVKDTEPLRYVGRRGRKFRAVRLQFFGFRGHEPEPDWLKETVILVTDPDDLTLITVIKPADLTHHLIGKAFDEGHLQDGKN